MARFQRETDFSRRCVISVFIMALAGRMTFARNIDINLAGDGCDNPSGYYVGDDDMATIFHSGSYSARPTRDDCTVVLRTDEGRRLEYLVEDARFQECGITISLDDSPSGLGANARIITCETRNQIPIQAKTSYNQLRLYVRKANVATDNFDFQMRLINDRGQSLDYRVDKAESGNQQEALEPGVIVGIAIAGVIIIIALVLLAIYLCIRARQEYAKDGASSAAVESNVYTSGNSQHLFANKKYPKRKYGSTEDVRSTTSSQEKTNGAYANQAYSANTVEKKSDRSNSIGRSRGKAGFANESFQHDDLDERYRGNKSWEEGDDYDVRIGSFRKSRIDSFKSDKKPKSALKKPSEIEMSRVNTQPINSILKKSRTKSPNRSQTSSTEGSLDTNAIMYGYNRSNTEHPNVRHKPVLERRRSRSGTRSNRSASSGGYSGSRRAHSADRKPKAKPQNTGRMYGEVFIDDGDKRARSSSRSRARSNSLRSRSHRGSDSVDSESSVASSRRVNMNPGGKRVHIKGEETDI